jgi:hypothetical protein
VADPRVLFVGNSFTFGAGSAALRFRASTVTDLNGSGFGGVPAMFKAIACELGVAYDVSHETFSGATLLDHYRDKLPIIDREWDIVVLQGYSTLDLDHPGDPTQYVRFADLIAKAVHARNPAVRVLIEATWSRADQTYLPGGHWFGSPISRMARDIRAAADSARAIAPEIAGVIPVGQAWNRAFASGIANPNPYAKRRSDQLELWSDDQYHASVYGHYLSALTILGVIAGIDPRRLGGDDDVARELEISPTAAELLQRIAWRHCSNLCPRGPRAARYNRRRGRSRT